jgi:YgiT-type zinc finger domain-containing protein
MREKSVPHAVDVGSCVVVVRNVPALVCADCGNVWFSGRVAAQLEDITGRVERAAITDVAVVNFVA